VPFKGAAVVHRPQVLLQHLSDDAQRHVRLVDHGHTVHDLTEHRALGLDHAGQVRVDRTHHVQVLDEHRRGLADPVQPVLGLRQVSGAPGALDEQRVLAAVLEAVSAGASGHDAEHCHSSLASPEGVHGSLALVAGVATEDAHDLVPGLAQSLGHGGQHAAMVGEDHKLLVLAAGQEVSGVGHSLLGLGLSSQASQCGQAGDGLGTLGFGQLVTTLCSGPGQEVAGSLAVLTAVSGLDLDVGAGHGLGRQVLEHLGLAPADHVVTDQLVVEAIGIAHAREVPAPAPTVPGAELDPEVEEGLPHHGVADVQLVPELFRAVQHGSAGEQHALGDGLGDGVARLAPCALAVHDIVALVEHEGGEARGAQHVLVAAQQVVVDDHDVGSLAIFGSHTVAFVGFAALDHLEDLVAVDNGDLVGDAVVEPGVDLARPVEFDVGRDHDERREAACVAAEVRQGLHGLAKAHVVGHDGPELLALPLQEPDAGTLEGVEPATGQLDGLVSLDVGGPCQALGVGLALLAPFELRGPPHVLAVHVLDDGHGLVPARASDPPRLGLGVEAAMAAGQGLDAGHQRGVVRRLDAQLAAAHLGQTGGLVVLGLGLGRGLGGRRRLLGLLDQLTGLAAEGGLGEVLSDHGEDLLGDGWLGRELVALLGPVEEPGGDRPELVEQLGAVAGLDGEALAVLACVHDADGGLARALVMTLDAKVGTGDGRAVPEAEGHKGVASGCGLLRGETLAQGLEDGVARLVQAGVEGDGETGSGTGLVKGHGVSRAVDLVEDVAVGLGAPRPHPALGALGHEERLTTHDAVAQLAALQLHVHAVVVLGGLTHDVALVGLSSRRDVIVSKNADLIKLYFLYFTTTSFY